MKPVMLFVYLIVVSGICFYFAFADQAVLKYFPIKDKSIRRTLFIIGGSVMLLSALLALYTAVAQSR
jgi:predicted ABC-type exoprotein transport system permease subunit